MDIDTHLASLKKEQDLLAEDLIYNFESLRMTSGEASAIVAEVRSLREELHLHRSQLRLLKKELDTTAQKIEQDCFLLKTEPSL